MSQQILDAIAEVKSLSETANSGVVEAQKLATQAANDSKSNTDELVKANATIVSISDAVGKATQDMQDINLKIQAIETTEKYIEKMVARMGGADGPANDELESKASEQMACYMRTGKAMDNEITDLVIRSMCQKHFYGLGEEKREAEIKTLIAGSNTDGGYFIRPERSAMIIKRIFESSPMRSIANIETTSSDVLEFVIDDDEATSGGWVGETSSRGETGTPKIGLLTIPAHEQFAQPKATQKMLEDAGFDIESWLSGKVTDKMLRTENTAFVLGDGSEKPRGYLQYPAWAVPDTYERFAIEQINSGSDANFTGDGVKALQNALKEVYQANAVWTIKRIEWQKIITLKDGAGAYLLEPRSLKIGDTLTLLGKQVMFFDDMPVAATDSLSLAYGDFSIGYTIVDRIGFRVIRDVVTQKPFILFYTTKRTGGAVTNYESFKIQKLSA